MSDAGYITVSEACALTGASKRGVRQWIRGGEVGSATFRGVAMVRRSDVLRHNGLTDSEAAKRKTARIWPAAIRAVRDR